MITWSINDLLHFFEAVNMDVGNMSRTNPPTLTLELHLQDSFQTAELGIRNDVNEISRLLIQTEFTSQAIFKTKLQRISYGYLPDGSPAALIQAVINPS